MLNNFNIHEQHIKNDLMHLLLILQVIGINPSVFKVAEDLCQKEEV